MRAPIRIATIAALVLLACDGPVEPHTAGTLSLHLERAASAPPVDAGKIVVSGPTNKTVNVTPGQKVTIDGLAPGPYSVAVEAFNAGVLVGVGKTDGLRLGRVAELYLDSDRGPDGSVDRTVDGSRLGPSTDLYGAERCRHTAIHSCRVGRGSESHDANGEHLGPRGPC